MTKAAWLELRLGDALCEQEDYDLLVMGRTQGTGCYCFVNGLLQSQLQKLQGSYPYIVVDNEAGMEHVSRGILPALQDVLLVSDCSRRGVQAAGRIARLIDELHLKPETVGLVVNRAPGGMLDAGTREEIERQGLTLLGVVHRTRRFTATTAMAARLWTCRWTARCARRSTAFLQSSACEAAG